MWRATKGKPDYVDKQVGENIKILRMIHNISQEELGASLGISFQQIQKYEKGINRISAGRLYHISKYLKISVADLFHGLD